MADTTTPQSGSPTMEQERPDTPTSSLGSSLSRMSNLGPGGEPLAIVGSACRFAGDINSPSRLWELLETPRELVSQIPADRFNIKGFYHPDGEYNGTTDSPKAYFIGQNHKHFDASFFNIRPKEAEAIDPQQRLMLEVVYEALESTGYTIDVWSGKSVAVYAGIMTADYDTLSQRDDLNTSQYYATGNARSIVSNRISYFFNWQGPSMTIDTACSSSLVALDQAVTNLRAGRCDVACVTGANMILTPEQFIAESSLHMLSPEGHCRMWDKGANGYARGEGVAAIFVKTLRQALMDGDRIEAVIRDIGVNSDGRTTGITMPSPAAQSELIQAVYFRANLDPKHPPDRCQYFEAHGTGTPAGDPREAEAIQDAFFTPYDEEFAYSPIAPVSSSDPSPHKFKNLQGTKKTDETTLLVGSIKTLIGHAEGAAGLAGLLKVIQLMRHGKITPNLHHKEINPAVAAVAKNLVVPTKLLDWPTPPRGQPKRASVNSFGFGGTNSHVIVEQYTSEYHDELIHYVKTLDGPDEPKDRKPVKGVDDPLNLPLFLSSNNKEGLARVAKAYRDYISPATNNEQLSLRHDLTELAWHLFKRRTAFAERAFVSGSTTQELAASLDALIAEARNSSQGTRGALIGRARWVWGGKDPKKDENGKETKPKPKILGVFTGQGSQWATMGLHLMKTSKRFCESIRESDRVLQNLPDKPAWTLEEEIARPADSSRVGDPEVAQPLCTAIQLALVQLLTYMGVEFSAVVGHSSGEVAAAYTAGRITAEHAIVIAFYRGKFAHYAKNPETGEAGDMIVASISTAEAEVLCKKDTYRGRLWVAAYNNEGLVTLSGDVSVTKMVAAELKARGKWHKELGVGIAYHSPHMEEPGEHYTAALKASNYKPLPYPREERLFRGLRKCIPWFSTVKGGYTEKVASTELQAEYWRENMVNPVRFMDGFVAAMSKGPYDCTIEVGPHPALRSIAFAISGETPYTHLLQRGVDDRIAFANFLGFMWVQFKAYENLLATYVSDSPDPGLPWKPRLEGLPLYPWDHNHEYWRESRVARQYHQRKDSPHELLGVRGRDDNDHLLRWRNVLKLHQIPWGTGHTFQGMHLVPASGYCSMAYDAAKFVLSGRKASVIELLDLRFWSGITLEEGSPGIETLFSLTIEDSTKDKPSESCIEGSFTLTSCPADGTTAMKMNFSGKLRIILEEPSLEALPARKKEGPETTAADAAAFYNMMSDTGLEYSGPFKGLTTLRKRTHFASGTVKQFHDEDSTQLTVSPGTLDSCLQTAFVTVASPGDRALWTPFLPESITRMRFNVASCEGKKNDDMLTIDAYLTDAKLATRESRASFTADIEIFGQQDRLQIQVEGLTVASFSTTKPEDDYEMYLTTVFDDDPDEAIVTAATITFPERAGFSLVESCERVAGFYETKRHLTTQSLVELPDPYSVPVQTVSTAIPANGWPEETEETLDAFIKQSRYFDTLDTIRRLGQMEGSAGMIKSMLRSFMAEAHHLVAFQNHVARVTKQIAHKYPRMKVLAITNPDLGLTGPILNAMDSAYSSYRVGAVPERCLEERLLTTPARRKKVTVAYFDFDEELEINPLYDMVVVSTSLIKGQGEHALRRIHSAMRPGGFLILLDSSLSPLLEKLSLATMGGNRKALLDTPANWAELTVQCGFTDSMKNSVQHFTPGYSLVVRQAHSLSKSIFRDPLEFIKSADHIADHIAEHILVIGGRNAWTGTAERNVVDILTPYCSGDIDTVKSLTEINIASLSKYTGVIMLADFDGPVLGDLNASSLEVMKALMSPTMKILWVTFNARTFAPDRAASIGFIRTLIAETPSLRVQVLDFNSSDLVLSGREIAKGFARLVMPHPGEGEPEEEKPLWIYETEVYMRRLVPLVARCLPWKEANARNNAPRRLVFDTVDSLDNIVDVSFVGKQDGSSGYELQVDKSYEPLRAFDTSLVIKVGYSTADALNLGSFGSSYISIGRHMKEDKVYVALSTKNTSYLKDPPLCTHDVALDKVNQPLFVALLSRYTSALATAQDTAANEGLVLFGPDPMFETCLKDALINYNIQFTIVSTNPERCGAADTGMTYVHPNSSTRDIKALYRLGAKFAPGTRVRIIDMLPEDSEISRVLRQYLPNGWRYDSASTLLTQENQVHDVSRFTAAKWQEAVGLTVAKLKEWEAAGFTPDRISISDLTARSSQLPPFHVIDWKADRSVQKPVTYMPEKNVLSPNKTYILVGITRDFGQSLSYMFADFGARHIILCSRKPPTETNWQKDLFSRGVKVEFHSLDVTDPKAVAQFAQNLEMKRKLTVGGVINGAMVLEDKVFATMSVETLHRVMRPKTIGSRNLDIVFTGRDMEFFIMTSSFAAIGGHAGQSNYAAANMFMNCLAVKRRGMGHCASTLNIGVIYGLGFLHREKSDLYDGLSREGYPPISERDIHHMFLEAIEAGKPKPDQVFDIITGLSRYDPNAPQHSWQEDPRFSHFTKFESDEEANRGSTNADGILERINSAESVDEIYGLINLALIHFMEDNLRQAKGTISLESTFGELGIDSLSANDYRQWFYKHLKQDVAVMKVLGSPNIRSLTREVAEKIKAVRHEDSNSDTASEKGPLDTTSKEKGPQLEETVEETTQPEETTRPEETAQPEETTQPEEAQESAKDHNTAYQDLATELSGEELYDDYEIPEAGSESENVAPPTAETEAGEQSGSHFGLDDRLRTVRSTESLGSSTASSHNGRGTL